MTNAEENSLEALRNLMLGRIKYDERKDPKDEVLDTVGEKCSLMEVKRKKIRDVEEKLLDIQ